MFRSDGFFTPSCRLSADVCARMQKTSAGKSLSPGQSLIFDLLEALWLSRSSRFAICRNSGVVRRRWSADLNNARTE